MPLTAGPMHPRERRQGLRTSLRAARSGDLPLRRSLGGFVVAVEDLGGKVGTFGQAIVPVSRSTSLDDTALEVRITQGIEEMRSEGLALAAQTTAARHAVIRLLTQLGAEFTEDQRGRFTRVGWPPATRGTPAISRRDSYRALHHGVRSIRPLEVSGGQGRCFRSRVSEPSWIISATMLLESPCTGTRCNCASAT